ncbi:MAG: ABC transporter ATP-binding protein [Pseudomonadales bacterium]
MTTTSAVNQGASRPPAIDLVKINKSFGPVHANKDVNLRVAKGTIHGIIGENGAGKSTLMSILYGFYEADSGEIFVEGTQRSIRSSSDAIAAGIGMVHQHFMLVENFSVLENVMLGAESSSSLRTSKAQARRELQRLSDEFGLAVDPDAITGELAVGLQQRVEILKALYRGADILILDEPTGVLTPQEVEQLFNILKALRERGVSVMLITHKLQEILAITDEVTVMRAGTMVASRETASTTKEELAELMVGRKVLLQVDKTPAQPAQALLQAQNLTLQDGDGIKRLDDVSFTLRAGEIVGIAGVSGNGQTELLDVLSGIVPVQQGSLVVGDVTIDKKNVLDAKDMRHLSMGHVAEDRHKQGMVTAFSARESAIMGYQDEPQFNGSFLMNSAQVTTHCEKLMQEFDVRPANPHLKSANFSGGNQQKLCIAREIERKPKVLLVGQPTRGVDIGAIEFIHQQIVSLRDAGSAVLVVSVELEEVMSLCDRIIVMFEGRIVGEMSAADADAKTLGLLMGNAGSQESGNE